MIFAIIAIIVIIVIVVRRNRGRDHAPRVFEPEEKRVGRQGEHIATDIIKSVLREGDHLFTGVEISYDGKKAELDNVIVNRYGVFIIEVKYYKGRLYGEEDDYEWVKYKDDGYGNTFEKNVKNPLKQVKRQTYILAKYIEFYGPRVWVEGYAFLVNGNSPVQSPYMLESAADINQAIHTFGKNRLTAMNVEAIRTIISKSDMNSESKAKQ